MDRSFVATGGIEPPTFRFQAELRLTPMFFGWADGVETV
jgi:hypothetical protein